MNGLARRVEALESVTAADDLPVLVVKFGRADATDAERVTRCEAWGRTFTRDDGESKQAFFTRVKAQRPAGNHSIILAF